MTQEYQETGQTENQRIHTAEQKAPQTGSITDAADKFAGNFLEQNPEVNEMLRPQTKAADLSDFSLAELLELAKSVGTTQDLDPAAAASLSRAIQESQL